MVRIVGHLSVYNSAQYVAALLVPIHKLLDELIVIDGAWRIYVALGYYDKVESSDNTKEVIESLNLKCPWKWIPSPKLGWESHSEKCAEFLKYLKPDDWQYYLNEDEIPIGDIEGTFNGIRADNENDMIRVPFYEICNPTLDKNSGTFILRFFKWKRGMSYGYTHCDLQSGDGINFRKWKTGTINKMQIVHLKNFRLPHMRDRTDKFFNNFTDTHLLGTRKTLEKFIYDKDHKV